MVKPVVIAQAISEINNQSSFIEKLLVDSLGWPIKGELENVEDISYGWSQEELNASNLSDRIIGGRIWQIQPFTSNQPWGIFLLEFNNQDVFIKGRGIVSPLRSILRGLVPKKRTSARIAEQPIWNRENLLFICTYDYRHYQFAYFKTPPESSRTAPLATFGWIEGDTHIRTLCEHNLPALEFPRDGGFDVDNWLKSWRKAFDVEAVTDKFFEEYKQIFEWVEDQVVGVPKGEKLRLYTQRLFNRLMFLYFIQKKGWLTYNGQTHYLRTLYDDAIAKNQDFLNDRLYFAFFYGLNMEQGKQEHKELFGEVPYLNGGLFEELIDQFDVQNAVKIPNECFGKLLSLFERYNFTITESTPFDIEVAVDPEMLGKVFEELVTGRHETGSYYTPRPIVSFMCREALKGYLKEKTEASESSLQTLIYDHDLIDLTESHVEQIKNALEELKAVDPACGSGAYLLGLMQELIAIRRALQSKKIKPDPKFLYDLKLKIISNNLYGVDIDTFAIEIAKLRLWLSLVVESDEPVALPNLDFKIETGDSLTAPVPSKGVQLSMHHQVIVDYSKLKDTYMKSHGEEKRKLKEKAQEKRDSIAGWVHGKEKLPKGAFDWWVEFAEVFLKRGFDIVLANPPYLRQEVVKRMFGDEYKDRLKKFYPKAYVKTADIYVAFYVRGLEIIQPKGMLVYISSNKWFRANYGKKLRQYMAESSYVKSITDFGDLPVFPKQTAYPMIFIAQKGEKQNGQSVFTLVETLEEPYPDIISVISEQGKRLPPEAISGEDWMLVDSVYASYIEQMRKSGTPLGKYVDGKIYRGVLTGLNKAFVIDSKKRAELIAEDPKSAEIIKPLAIGKDIKKWSINSDDKWLIVTKIGVKIKRYPAVYEHLKLYMDKLEKRWDKGHYWWELRACDYYEAFETPKIIWGNLGLEPEFAFSSEPLYTIAPANIIPTTDLFLLGIMNSSVSKRFFDEIAIQRSGKYLEFKPIYVSQLPIPEATDEEKNAIAELIKKCLDAKGKGCGEWEAEIDELVARLYGIDLKDLEPQKEKHEV